MVCKIQRKDILSLFVDCWMSSWRKLKTILTWVSLHYLSLSFRYWVLDVGKIQHNKNHVNSTRNKTWTCNKGEIFWEKMETRTSTSKNTETIENVNCSETFRGTIANFNVFVWNYHHRICVGALTNHHWHPWVFNVFWELFGSFLDLNGLFQ